SLTPKKLNPNNRLLRHPGSPLPAFPVEVGRILQRWGFLSTTNVNFFQCLRVTAIILVIICPEWAFFNQIEKKLQIHRHLC
ncbi:hypothetical protein ACFOZ5_14165, partial [Marinobacter lacisalsi]